MSTTSDAAAVHPLPRRRPEPVADLSADAVGQPPARQNAPEHGPVAAEQVAAGPPGMSMRASDAERAEIVERLHQALGAGRLDLHETDERVAAAYAARYRHELTALLTDLPTTDAPLGAAPSWAALWMLAVWRARAFVTGEPASARPTPRQLRSAGRLTAVLLVWFVACVVLGAAAVGA